MKNLGIILSSIWGVMIVGVIMYHANDVGCDPSPIGLSGAIRIILFLLLTYMLGFASAKIHSQNSA